MSGRWTEVAALWVGKDSVANGQVTSACKLVLEPGDRLVIQKIRYERQPAQNAPEFKLFVVADTDDKRDAGQQSQQGGGGFSR